MHKQYAFLAVSGLFLAACSDSTTPSGPSRLAPVVEVSGNIQTQIVPDEYVVVLRTPPRGTNALVAELQGMAGVSSVQILSVYGTALNGFAIKATPAALAALRANANIDFIQPNQVVFAIATQSPTPSWGLDRIDQRNFPLDNSFTYPTGGAVVHIYIIDTGIRMTHNEFTGRIGTAKDCITPAQTPPGNDGHGHGTHVAGTAGGTTYGITKNAILHAVRVLDNGGSGTTQSVVCGIDWVAANFIGPAVSNMSIGGPIDPAIDNATNSMANAGVVSAVAAGNNNANACNGSPARAANAITVGATGTYNPVTGGGTPSDNRSSFSNFGTCLDIFAPGSGITSAWNTNNSATATISGTSMASPHVAGVAALYRSFNPTHTPAQVATALINNATMNVVGNPGTGSPNRLLYMGFITGGPPNQNPNANFTYVCNPAATPPNWRCDVNGSTSTDPDGTVVSWAWSSPGKPNKTGVTSSFNFPAGSTPSVTLTVTDNSGGTNSQTQQLVVGTPTNLPPTANFTVNCVPRPTGGADCTLNGSSSTDSDGTIVSYAWTATNKPNQTGVIVIYSYPSGVMRTFTLTVTDDDGATNTKSVTITTP